MKRDTTATRLLAFVFFGFACCHALASGTLVYNGTNIMERWQNDGWFNSQNQLTVTVNGDNFVAGTDFIAGGQVTAVNVPYSLTPVATRTATNKVSVSLSGFANTNGPSATTNGLQFVFNDSAFSNGPASSITWAGGSNLTVSFRPVASNWYVSASGGSEANDGTSASTPFLSITNAIKHAQANANDVINIAAGAYTAPAGGISITKPLTFLGASPASTIIQAAATPGMATNAIFLYTASTTPAMFQYLTLQNGRASAGGAIFAYTYAADLIASNCVFINNSATNAYGGAIDHPGGTATYLTLIACTFSNNTATNTPSEVGGAIYTQSDTLTISNCVFAGNSAFTNGGAVNINASGAQPVSVINTLFINNTALTGTGGGGSFGGSGPMGIYGCTFASNSAPLGGGGFYVKGPLVVTNSTFYANTSTNGVGGGINSGYGNGSRFSGFLIYNSTFFGNTASNGGGITINYKEGALYSSIIAGNTALIGLAPDIYISQTTTGLWATNSLIGATNSIGKATDAPSLTNAAALNMPNASGNYCGSAATPQLSGLLPLAWNGGSQPTCALQPTSVAIHTGANPLGLLYDERGPGYARSNAQGQTDMGAYEYGSQPSAVNHGTTVFFQ